MRQTRQGRHLRQAVALAITVLAASLLFASGCATQRPGAAGPGPGNPPVPGPVSGPASGTASEPAADFIFLGEALIPKAAPAGIEPLSPHPTPVGGLSGLVFDPKTGDYLALSDSRGEHGPVRVYSLEIELGPAGKLPANGVRVLAVTDLLNRDGKPFAVGTVDPEGIALAPGGGFYVSSEGVARAGIAPFVRRVSADGKMIDALPLPAAYLPRGGAHPRGVRNNLGFEPLGVTPPTSAAAGGHRYLFTGTENALAQDGPKATVEHGSSSRLLRWTLTTDGTATGPPVEWIYPVSPVAEVPPPSTPQPDGLPVNGLVELIALGPDHLLTLERSYTEGAGTTVRLYRVELDGATAVTGRASVTGPDAPVPAKKTLLLDLTKVLAARQVPTDNLEGMTFGPDLPDGRKLLLLVSDDNFSCTQRTQVVAFAVAPSAL